MRVMISCGEPSGDLYAGALAAEILEEEPSTTIVGFGGDRLAAAGATLVQNFSGLSVTGLLEVVRVLPRTYATYRRLITDAEQHPPDVFVAIDFPDFNFALARALKKRGVPIVYYISPQLWAWRASRMQTMKRLADRVLVIFPFEEQIYRDAGVPVEWVGPSALRRHAAPPVAGGVPGRARARSFPPGPGAASRESHERGAVHPAGHRAGGHPDPSSGAWRTVRGRARASP